MRILTGSAVIAAMMMLWNVGTVVPASAANPKSDVQTATRDASSGLSEFSSQRRRHRHFGHIRHYRRAFASYRPYHYRAYYRPAYRAYYRPYYRPRAIGFYRPWYRPYYRAHYRPAYTYYHPVGYGWPYAYYGPRTYVSIGPFGFGLF